MMRLRVGMLCVLLCASSCSIAFQKSVRSSKAECSTSRFWWMSDVLIAGGLAYGASSGGAPAPAYALPALFLGSALIGGYKRGNCLHYREVAALQAQVAQGQPQVVPQVVADQGGGGGQPDQPVEPQGQAEPQTEDQPQVQPPVEHDPNYPPPPPDVSRPTVNVNVNVRPGRPPPVRTEVRRHEIRGGTTITLNGCTYTDGPTGFTGRSCGNGCPGGYTCLASEGNICAPSNQVQACSRSKGYRTIEPPKTDQKVANKPELKRPEAKKPDPPRRVDAKRPDAPKPIEAKRPDPPKPVEVKRPDPPKRVDPPKRPDPPKIERRPDPPKRIDPPKPPPPKRVEAPKPPPPKPAPPPPKPAPPDPKKKK